MMVKFLTVVCVLCPSYQTVLRTRCLCALLLLGICAVGASPAQARLILLSTSGSAELAGLSFDDDDLVLFDTETNTASLFFDGDLYEKDEDTNAVSVLPNGNLLLSTLSGAKLGGLSFKDGDIVEYDPSTDTASLYFSEDLFAKNEEINAVSILENGNLVLSTSGKAKAELGGLAFEQGDLVEYDLATGEASRRFDGDLFEGGLFEGKQNIRAAHVLKNGNIALSMKKKAALGGITFGDDSIIEYDPIKKSASLIFDGSALFSDRHEDINALYIFEDDETFKNAALKSSLGRRLKRAPAPSTVPAQGHLILLSTSGSAELAGLSFDDEDLVLFDTKTNTASLFFDGSLYKKDEDTNAVSVLPNGNLLLSTINSAKLGGLSFKDGDVVEYDPSTDTASLYFSEDLFAGDEEINALSILENGNLVLSTRRTAKLGGLAFKKGDLVEYDRTTGKASLFFDGGLFDGGLFEGKQNIRAAHVLRNGNIALSTKKKASLGGIIFGDDSIIEYDPIQKSASLLFDGSALFSNLYEDINALYIFEDVETFERAALKSSFDRRLTHVPEPSTLALFGACVVMLVLVRKKKALLL